MSVRAILFRLWAGAAAAGAAAGFAFQLAEWLHMRHVETVAGLFR